MDVYNDNSFVQQEYYCNAPPCRRFEDEVYEWRSLQ